MVMMIFSHGDIIMQSKILVQTQECKKTIKLPWTKFGFFFFLHDYFLHGESTLRWTKDDS
jgi:hypothetical protein